MHISITREKAFELILKYNQDKSDLNHYLESEVVMRGIARYLKEDEDYYGMLGLMHDVDWGVTKNNPKEHLTKAPKILSEAGFDDEFIKIVLSHGYGFDCAGLKEKKREKQIEHALACCETVTGLIHSYALMRGSINGMEVSGLKKKFKDKRFAAGVDREIIKECEKINVDLDTFFKIAIDSISNISKEVGLNG
jgi:uncharacterized protein